MPLPIGMFCAQRPDMRRSAHALFLFGLYVPGCNPAVDDGVADTDAETDVEDDRPEGFAELCDTPDADADASFDLLFSEWDDVQSDAGFKLFDVEATCVVSDLLADTTTWSTTLECGDADPPPQVVLSMAAAGAEPGWAIGETVQLQANGNYEDPFGGTVTFTLRRDMLLLAQGLLGDVDPVTQIAAPLQAELDFESCGAPPQYDADAEVASIGVRLSSGDTHLWLMHGHRGELATSEGPLAIDLERAAGGYCCHNFYEYSLLVRRLGE